VLQIGLNVAGVITFVALVFVHFIRHKNGTEILFQSFFSPPTTFPTCDVALNMAVLIITVIHHPKALILVPLLQDPYLNVT
jgi:hypothetical protein